MSEQMNIFECLYPPFKNTKPIRLIELFAGYGSQALALDYLGVKFEHWKICEWNYKSIQAYKDIHMPDDHKDYSALFTKDVIIRCLANMGISSNWNEPMKYEQIKRLNESKLREIYNNIQSTHNLVDVSKIHANDLEIINKDQYTYILTYSFPCQDLSLAGRREGMDRSSETRSSLLWEVERILLECKEDNCLPDVLLMENVPQVHGTENARNWREWLTQLERLGYSNYWQDLIATDYGIPQIRNRTFCVSLLGEYAYSFPQPIELEKRLKDMLEDKVNEKYYLSKQMFDFFSANSEKQKENGNGFRFEVRNQDEPAKSITTRSGDRMDDNFIESPVYEVKPPHGYFPGKAEPADTVGTIDTGMAYWHTLIGEKQKAKVLGNIYGNQVSTSFAGNVWDTENNSPTLTTMGGGNRQPLIIAEDNRQPKAIVALPVASRGRGEGWQQQFEFRDEETANALTTVQKDSMVAQVMTVGNYSPSGHNATRIVDPDGVPPTVMENHGQVTAITEDDKD